MPINGEYAFIGAAGIGFGAWMISTGLQRRRLQSAIESLPTSKVAEMMPGLVELTGKAAAATPSTDPIFGKPCLFHRIQIWEYRFVGTGRNMRREWVSIHFEDTTRPFWLEDETGRAFILPYGAEARYKTNVRWESGQSEADPALKRFVTSTAGDPGNPIRLAASIIRQGDPFFVLGWACPAEESIKTAAPTDSPLCVQASPKVPMQIADVSEREVLSAVATGATNWLGLGTLAILAGLTILGLALGLF